MTNRHSAAISCSPPPLAGKYGNPPVNIDLFADPDKNFVVIMKHGKIYRNTLQAAHR